MVVGKAIGGAGGHVPSTAALAPALPSDPRCLSFSLIHLLSLSLSQSLSLVSLASLREIDCPCACALCAEGKPPL